MKKDQDYVCPDWIKKDVQKRLKTNGSVTWQELRLELRISYAAVIRAINYLVQHKILLPQDENGKYFPASHR